MSLYARFADRARSIGSALRIAHARATGVQFGSGCEVARGCDLALGNAPHRRGVVALGERNQLGCGVILHPYGGSIEVGSEVHLGPYCVLYGHGGIHVGSHVLFGPQCRVFSSNHTVPPLGHLIRYEPDTLAPTKIGSDVWLGAGVTVLAGVTIGDGCVVGAGAVVSRDLPPHSIAYGVPADVRGSRLSP